MKIRVVGNRKPVIGGKKRLANFEAEVSAGDGAHLIKHGLAEALKPAPAPKKKKVTTLTEPKS